MNRHKLITAGCSLSPKHGWATEVANILQASHDWTHFGIGASSNGVQINLLEEEIVNYGIGEGDVVIFQITGQNRGWGIIDGELYHKYAHTLDENSEFDADGAGVGTYVSRINTLDNKKRYVLLSHHEAIKSEARVPVCYYNARDPYIELQRLLYTLIMLRKSGCKVLVFRGWEGVMSDTSWDIFKEKFKLHDIYFLEECIVEWCLTHKVPFLDEFHPSPKQSRIFTKRIIGPVLDRHIIK
jgi:hypothetical protein